MLLFRFAAFATDKRRFTFCIFLCMLFRRTSDTRLCKTSAGIHPGGWSATGLQIYV